MADRRWRLDVSPAIWRKAYADSESLARAIKNHSWLATLTPASRVPAVLAVEEYAIIFERVAGVHVGPSDLAAVAAHLGYLHAAAYVADLHRGPLDSDAVVDLVDGHHHIPGFLANRAKIVLSRVTSGAAPGLLLDPKAADALMHDASLGPAAIYKDSNPRNLLITDSAAGATPSGPVIVDFDDLTLAPFGYDLAKLIVGVAMTTGPVSDLLVSASLTAYNDAVQLRVPDLPEVSNVALAGWMEIHHVLTFPYLGRNGYRYSWNHVRPPGVQAAARSLSWPRVRPGRL